jgi:hypothetical protein
MMVLFIPRNGFFFTTVWLLPIEDSTLTVYQAHNPSPDSIHQHSCVDIFKFYSIDKMSKEHTVQYRTFKSNPSGHLTMDHQLACFFTEANRRETKYVRFIFAVKLRLLLIHQTTCLQF